MIMNSFNYQKKSKVENDQEGGGPSAPLVENFRNISKMDKEDINNQVLLIDLLKDKDYIKAILVIGIKQVTWKNELRYDYELHHEKIEKFIDKMEQLGFIISKRLYHVPEIVYHSLIQTNNAQFYHQSPNIYVLTDYGKAFMESAVEYISKTMKSNQYITNLIFMIEERTKDFHTKIEEITKKEEDKDILRVKFPNDVTVDKETESYKRRQRQLAQAVKIATLEFMQEKPQSLLKQVNPGKLLSYSKYELVTLEEEKQLLLGKTSIAYTPAIEQTKRLRIDKVIEQSEGVQDSELQEVEQISKQKTKECLEYFNEDYKVLKNEKQEKERVKKLSRKNMNECDDFINSLS